MASEKSKAKDIKEKHRNGVEQLDADSEGADLRRMRDIDIPDCVSERVLQRNGTRFF